MNYSYSLMTADTLVQVVKDLTGNLRTHPILAYEELGNVGAWLACVDPIYMDKFNDGLDTLNLYYTNIPKVRAYLQGRIQWEQQLATQSDEWDASAAMGDLGALSAADLEVVA